MHIFKKLKHYNRINSNIIRKVYCRTQHHQLHGNVYDALYNHSL